MRIKIPVIIALSFLLLFAGQEIYSNRSAAPVARSGGAGESTCAVSTCHGGTPNTGPGEVAITSTATNNQYSPGATYTISVTVTQSALVRYGFEILVGHHSGFNATQGTILITNATGTQLITSGQKKYVTHRTAGTIGTTGTHTWSFDWVAPVSGMGDLGFYVAGNATNDNNAKTGDLIYTSSMVLAEATVSIANSMEHPWIGLTNAGTDRNNELILKNFPKGEVNVEILDVNGKTISSKLHATQIAETRIQIPTQNLEQGIYFLKTSSESLVKTQKFVVYE